MKKKNSLLFILLMYSLTMLAQKDITKFMGIPVDGFKKDMIQKLKAKGFEYDNEIDLLTGEFNGEKVNIFVATQSNKVWRIVVADAIERNEHEIKIRFNTFTTNSTITLNTFLNWKITIIFLKTLILHMK